MSRTRNKSSSSTRKTGGGGGGVTQFFTVTFKLNGGIGNIPPLTVSKGKTITKPDAPTLTDFAFGLWYQDKERKVPFFFDTPITQNLTLYAGWNKPNHFTVRFHSNGGTHNIADQTIALNNKAHQPENPTKPDATFINWYKDSTFITPFNFDNEMITENIILYAGWGYTVMFDTDGGSVIDPITVLSGNTVIKPPNLTKTDFAFGEWYKDEARLTPFFFDAEKITKPTTIYAKWNKFNHFTVRFHPNGGTHNIADQTIALDNKAHQPENPTKPDATFVNWYTDSVPTTASTPFDFIHTKITGNIILYAGWGFAVMFNSNAGSVIANQSVFSGSVVSKPTNPTKPDATFVNWYTDSVPTTTSTPFDFIHTKITGNIILYAGWGFAVTFNSNAGSVIANQSVFSGSVVSKPTNPTKLGFTFVNWYTDSVPTTASIPFDFIHTKITENTTLYAGWGFAVTFNSNAGSVIANQSVFSGSVVSKPTNPTKLGFTFVNWYTDSTLTTAFDFITTQITENITLYAGWGYTVMFDTDGGSVIDPITVLSGNTITKLKNPTKTDRSLGILTFGGWYKDSELTTVFFDTDTITRDTILYTRWNLLNHFTVRFHSNGGSTIPEQTITLNAKSIKPTSDPTKLGVAFVGWYTDSTLTTASIPFDFIHTKITENITLYAGWSLIWRAVFAGYYHTVGIKADGTLWAWGFNNNGQLGLGNTTNQNRPQKVGSDNTWKAVAAGSSHTVGIQTNGTLWAWGYNTDGQLGLGNTTNQNRPQKVGSDNTWKAVAAGNYHTLGIKTDNKLWVWGKNFNHQLGVNGVNDRLTPIQLVSIISYHKQDWNRITWSMVAAGVKHTVAIKKDGTLWTWGFNEEGQLGLGDLYSVLLANKVGGYRWSVVIAGDNHTVAIRNDDTLWVWGHNNRGQLGLGDMINRNSPRRVNAAKWKAVAAGVGHTVAIKKDGTLWIWGHNYRGQLGLGDKTDRIRPTVTLEAPTTP